MHPRLSLPWSSNLVLSIKLLTLHLYLGPNQSLSGLLNVWKEKWPQKGQVTSSRYENLILLHFYLEMLNDIDVENLWESLRYKFQLKQINKSREMLQPMETAFWEKWA